MWETPIKIPKPNYFVDSVEIIYRHAHLLLLFVYRYDFLSLTLQALDFSKAIRIMHTGDDAGVCMHHHYVCVCMHE